MTRIASRVQAAIALAVAASCSLMRPATSAAQAGTHPPSVPIAPAHASGAPALAELVAGVGNTMRVLMIAAHPDDEDTRLLTWLARGQHVEVAYLSLTRGDGGQNLIGNELGDALGVIRTEELLAARRIDGAHQFFSRAYDFGFSKTAEETYTHWPHDSVLEDVVTIIRAFRPHVIVAVFSGTPRDGHGHHQVSGLIAREAYDVSGDTTRYPAAKFGTPWVASKFYRDRSYFGAGDSAVTIDVGAYDPLLGVSYAEIAAASRSQHRSQGMGSIIGPAGPVKGFIYREASRLPAPSAPERSMFDGIDTTWGRSARTVRDAQARAYLDSLPLAVRRVQSQFRLQQSEQLAGSLSDLARVERGLATRLAIPLELPESKGSVLPPSSGTDVDLARTVQLAWMRTEEAQAVAAGIENHATVARDVAAVGSADIPVATTVTNRGKSALHVDGAQWVTASGRSQPATIQNVVPTDSTWRDTVAVQDTVVTQPWWLRTPRNGDLFTQPVSRIPEDELPGAAVVALGLKQDVAGAVAFQRRLTAVDRIADPARGEVDRPLAFVPAVSVSFDQTVQYVRAATRIDRSFRVTLRSGVAVARDVTVSIHLPDGLAADTAARHITLQPYGTQHVDFRIIGTLAAGDRKLSVSAESEGQTFRVGYVPIEYDHIRSQKLYRPSEVQLSVVDVKIPEGLTVGYIAGVGDNVEPTLTQLGLHVSVLDPAALPSTDLSQFTTIVVGPRAYGTSDDLRANNGRLLDFARGGGTLVVQYGQYEMASPGIMPYPITLSRPADRVTVEGVPVRVLDPTAPVLNQPNKIVQSDFDGWIQERSLYMPHTFDSHYHAILSMNDPNEPPNDGGILITPLGKGTYVYTTLSFFRQLPGGVPGPARLFLNLLVAGRKCCETM